MTTETSFFKICQPIEYYSKASKRNIIIPAEHIRNIVVKTNEYLYSVDGIFKENAFLFFNTLGQRNLSGFIGEVFSSVLEKTIPNYKKNPHADGRPDLLDLSSEEARDYFGKNCIAISDLGEEIPIREHLAPFRYGGIEVKTTIGSLPSRKKDDEKKQMEVGNSRAHLVTSLSFWGHHGSCESLLGLYYDYIGDIGVPQIIAVMYTMLDPQDWRPVSTGKAGSKKTSNTSLSITGNDKISQGLITYYESPLYLDTLRRCGIHV